MEQISYYKLHKAVLLLQGFCIELKYVKHVRVSFMDVLFDPINKSHIVWVPSV